MKSGFTAHVSVSGYSIEFDAVLSLAPPSETGERDFDLRFISPESLCGIRLMRTGDGLSVLLGDDLFTETEFEKFRDLAMFSFIESMSAGAAVRSVLSVKGSDCGMPHIERLTAVSTRDFTVYIDPASGFPLKIERNDGVILNIKNFTPHKIA